MKIRILLTGLVVTALCCLVGNAVAGPAMAPYWSKGFGDFGDDKAYSVATDGLGNVVVVGTFEGTVNFGGSDLNAIANDIFVAKFNRFGMHLWSHSFGDVGYDFAYDVAIDNVGSIYVTGTYEGQIELGGASFLSNGGRDIFLVKFNTNGGHMWSQSFGSAFGNDEGKSVAIDTDGNVVLGAEFGYTVSFGGASLVSAGNSDVAIAKFNTFGTHLWSHVDGGPEWDFVGSLATSPVNDSVVMIGCFGGSANFGGTNLVSAGGDDIYVVSYAQSGSHQWSKRIGGTAHDAGEGIAIDSAGQIAITGSFLDVVDFGSGPVPSSGGTTSYLVMQDANGSFEWQRIVAQSHGLDLAFSPTDQLYFAALVLGTGDFGDGDLTSAGSFDVALAWYGNDGTHRWSNIYGGPDADAPFGVAVDNSGNPTVVGEFKGPINFGSGSIGSNGDFDIFIAKWFGEIEIGPFNDCPNDRGRCATMVWERHELDGPPIPIDPPGPPVVKYSIWRAVGTLPMYPPDPVHSCPIASETGRDPMGCDGWELVYEVEATQKEIYDAVVSTTRDASTTDPAMHYFVLLAENGEGGWHTSDPDSIATTNDLGAMITTIVDVPADEGRSVLISFNRDSEDAPGASTPILGYEIYREDASARVSAYDRAPEPDEPQRIEGWTYLSTTLATGAASYNVAAVTLGDSTVANGGFDSRFFVRATTTLPTTFYDSPSAFGHSLDNLAPMEPTGVAYSNPLLTWDTSPTPDFDYFTVYGASSNDFGSAVVVDYTVAPSANVSASPYGFYFVTATDESGNESTPAALQVVTGFGDNPTRFVLSLTNYPNPFNPATTLRYTVPASGHVDVAVYAADGRKVKTLVSRSHNTGAFSVRWDGRDESGRPVASGVYFARIVHPQGVHARKLLLLK